MTKRSARHAPAPAPQTDAVSRAVQRVNVDFPTDLLRAIDAEATRIGVPRQAFIKLRLADVLTKKVD